MSQELPHPWIAPDAGLGRVLVGEHQVEFRSFGPNSHASDFMSQPVIDEAAASERLRKETLLFVGWIEPIDAL